MPHNPLMLNNKKINIPKEKPKPPSKSIRERLFCWVRLLFASLLAGGKFFVFIFIRHSLSPGHRPVLSDLPVPDGGGPRPQHHQWPLRARARGVSRAGLQTRYW